MGTNIGDKVYIGAALPAAETAAGYAAVTWTEIGGVLDIGELKETVADQTQTPIATGRTQHYLGAVDGGTIPVTVQNLPSDAGQVAVKTTINSGVNLPMKIVNAAGEIRNFYGLYANGGYTAKNDTSLDNWAFEIRVNSAAVAA